MKPRMAGYADGRPEQPTARSNFFESTALVRLAFSTCPPQSGFRSEILLLGTSSVVMCRPRGEQIARSQRIRPKILLLFRPKNLQPRQTVGHLIVARMLRQLL